MPDDNARSFAEAGGKKGPGLAGEFLLFLKQHKKFWMIPLLSALFCIGLLVVLGGTAAAPFIYSLF
ncbi:MAG: DUF5989 family protein [Verrucomicrobiota bacterium]